MKTALLRVASLPFLSLGIVSLVSMFAFLLLPAFVITPNYLGWHVGDFADVCFYLSMGSMFTFAASLLAFVSIRPIR